MRGRCCTWAMGLIGASSTSSVDAERGSTSKTHTANPTTTTRHHQTPATPHHTTHTNTRPLSSILLHSLLSHYQIPSSLPLVSPAPLQFKCPALLSLSLLCLAFLSSSL